MIPAVKVKLVYLNRLPIGSAANWGEASLVVSAALDRDVTVPETMKRGNEGPEGFYVSIAQLTLV